MASNMTIDCSDPTALSLNGVASERPLPTAHDPPKLPNLDDIHDLADLTREATDALSRLLREEKWKQRLSTEHRQLFGNSVHEFRIFCDNAGSLLKTFLKCSYSLSHLFKLILNSERPWPPSLQLAVKKLLSEIENASAGIPLLKQLYAEFYLRFRGLIVIAPAGVRLNLNVQGLDKGEKVFQRLDAFWRVVANQLSDVLTGVSKPPHPDNIREAENGWLENAGCLIGAIDVLRQSSDVLKVGYNGLTEYDQKTSGISLRGFVKKGFRTFWRKLTKGSAEPSIS